ncbi:MAG: ATP synthase F1 subunit gamma [Bacteroidetes bacterium]|nr:MAG: ATP synthase F1 subunit gamma [Bacteroidota bacterium]
MANLKEIRNRITSVGSTMQITSAMKMVSAAKLKRAQDAIVQMRPYAEKLKEILNNLSATLDLSENAYAEERELKNVLIIGVSSNRGLCGGFNNNVIKEMNRLVAEKYQGKNVQFLGVGKKVSDAFRKGGAFIPTTEYGVEDVFADLSFDEASEIAKGVMEGFLSKKFDQVVIVYNSFINAANQEIKSEQFLPVQPTVSEGGNSGDYIFEPSKMEIVEELIPKSLKIQFFKALRDSFASEHGARMTAMHKATDNADALKRELTLSYNKARQAAITNEILEIVGGAEALNG